MHLLSWISRQPTLEGRQGKLVALITTLTDNTPAALTAYEQHLLADFVAGRLSMEEVVYFMDVENERLLAHQQLVKLRAARYFFFFQPSLSLN